MKKVITIVTGVLGALFLVLGIIIKVKKQMSFVIGGADGPTSVFLAGKLGSGPSFSAIGAGVVLLFVAVVLALTNHK